ncbi:retrovirus-related pol polyprotein from transposon TNT 1-94 [Tanacetum coccineum]
MMHMLTKPQVFYDEAHKTALGYQNHSYLTQAQQKVPSFYYGNIIVKPHHVLSVTDIEETLELAEESRLKMHARQNDPIMQEKKVNIAPIDYVALNKLSDHFVKHFVPQKKLSTEQAFWLPISKPVSKIPLVQPEPVLKEIPHELPKISLVKESFNKMRSRVNDFENLIISQDLVHTAVNTLVDYNKMEQSYVDEYNECLELKTGLSKKNDVVEKAVYNEEHADTLHEIIEHARDLRPLDSDLDSACKYATRVQELLVYVETHALVLSDKFTWVKFLRSKDETPKIVIKLLKKIQVHLNATVRNIQTDNGTEFANQTLQAYYDDVGISHQTSVARTP